ncbi:hypothetical protein C1H46_031664 [Malus baccata]|uniref:Uncharacterized protein n=1 Tax=Malus baccata TaxID=106549 RepID=A0A540L8G6_MALBA|nr:hypothetical protein C1H46_031664 [Malus baccata]
MSFKTVSRSSTAATLDNHYQSTTHQRVGNISNTHFVFEVTWKTLYRQVMISFCIALHHQGYRRSINPFFSSYSHSSRPSSSTVVKKR